ncbi:MAG: NYN domain-containing protein [Candidatus Omnitrophica bacterium]|nr:NYN domain-containing protein [Candidatus Omnitrophota bacterium]
MAETLEKLKHYLTPSGFVGIILESFSQRETARLMASLGAVYPGTRIESIDHEELARGLVEDAVRDPGLFMALEKALDRAHEADLEEMKDLSVGEIKQLLAPIGEIYERKGIGKLLWVLLKDERHEVNELIPGFLRSVYRYSGKIDKKHEEIEDFKKRLTEGKISKEEIRGLQHMLFSKFDEVRNLQRKLKERERKIEDLCEERRRLKGDIASLRRMHDQFARDLVRLKRDLEHKDAVLRELQEAVKKMPKTEERQLYRQLHDLERENRKQEHELQELKAEVLRQKEALWAETASKIRLARDLEVLRAEKVFLEGQLAQAVKGSEITENQPEEAVCEKTAQVPKDKGKRLGIFVDMQNIWIASKRFGRKIDFQKLLDLIVLDRHLVKALAYVVVIPGLDQEAFFNMLKRRGFEVRYRTLIRRADGSAKGNWDTGMVVDVIKFVDKNDLDIIHVVSGDGDFADLLKFVKTKGVRVEASGFPFNTAQELIKCADEFFPLDENILKEVAPVNLG